MFPVRYISSFFIRLLIEFLLEKMKAETLNDKMNVVKKLSDDHRETLKAKKFNPAREADFRWVCHLNPVHRAKSQYHLDLDRHVYDQREAYAAALSGLHPCVIPGRSEMVGRSVSSRLQPFSR